MLTPYLEKLILSGKAAYKTFVAGGTQKHILNVPNDRFIIITDLLYYSNFNVESSNVPPYTSNDRMKDINKQLNTQLKIFSFKSNNSYLFRNSFTAHPHNANNLNTDWWIFPTHAPTKIDTYLIHESDVSFTFSWAGLKKTDDLGLTEINNIAFPPPFDYGAEGLPGSEPVVRRSSVTTGFGFNHQGQKTADVDNEFNNLELIYPVEAAYSILDTNYPANYPLVNVGYVEIKGNPTNIEQTS